MLAGRAVDDAAFLEPSARVFVVVSLVAVELGRFAPPPTTVRTQQACSLQRVLGVMTLKCNAECARPLSA